MKHRIGTSMGDTEILENRIAELEAVNKATALYLTELEKKMSDYQQGWDDSIDACKGRVLELRHELEAAEQRVESVEAVSQERLDRSGELFAALLWMRRRLTNGENSPIENVSFSLQKLNEVLK